MKNISLLTENNVDVQKSLELLGDMETYDSMLNDFLDGIGKKMEDIKKFEEIMDMANYAILVHSLKSDAKYLGFNHLAEISYSHELESKANNSGFVYEHYDELVGEVNRITALIKKYLESDNNQEKSLETSETSSKRKILVVDDSDLIRNIIVKMFDNEFEVLTSIDGQQALNIISRETTGLFGVLLDLYMPNVNGFAVLEYFQKYNLFDKIPVVIITGDTSRETVEKAVTYPIVDVLAKPFDKSSIERVIRAMENFKNMRNQ